MSQAPISERERAAQREAWVRTRLRESFNLALMLEVIWEAYRIVSDSMPAEAAQRLVSNEAFEGLEQALARAERKP